MAIDTSHPPKGRISRHPAQRVPHTGKPTGHPVHQLQRHQTPAPQGHAQKVMSRGGRKRITKQHVNECPCCDGWGYVPAMAPVIENDDEGRPVTISLGMGCEHCLGVGRLTHPPHRNRPGIYPRRQIVSRDAADAFVATAPAYKFNPDPPCSVDSSGLKIQAGGALTLDIHPARGDEVHVSEGDLEEVASIAADMTPEAIKAAEDALAEEIRELMNVNGGAK